MEKGSFHTSSNPSNPIATMDELVKKIPLPNQLPNGVNFRDIPSSALHSSTLESLISQNEDLMARLSMSLRKANQFEERSAVLEKENSSFRAKFETLREQYMILHEKDRLFSNRSQQLLEENGTVKAHQQKLEKVYSELYVQAQAFQRKLMHLERYRARIRKAAPKIQEAAKRIAGLEEEFTEAKKALSMAHMQSVNSYEAKLADVRQQIDILRGKANERDQIFEEKVRIENQQVVETRQQQIYREETDAVLSHLQQENSEIRLQLKESLLRQESQRVELQELGGEIPALKDENKALRDQVESLQALWAHKQKELDQLEGKSKSLQKLNQSLSINLNQQRKDHQILQTELDSERFTMQEKIKLLNAELQMIRAQTSEVLG